MTTRLFVEGYEVDLIQDIDVDFTFSITDIQDIEKRNTSYSKTIVIPHSPNNANLFGHIYDIAVENDYNPLLPNININFNPAKQAKAVLYVDNVRIFDGIIRLINIKNKQGEITYEVNLFGKLKDILFALGDKLIEDIDFSDYNHQYNQTQVFDSWNRLEWVDGADNYVYPLIDFGYGNTATNFKFENFKPCLFVREVIKRMFDDAGFIIDTAFFDTTYFKSLLYIKGDKMTISLSNFLNVYIPSWSYFGTGTADDISFNFIDLNNGFTPSLVNKRWTSNRSTFKATFSFEADSLGIDNTGNVWDAIATIDIQKNGTTIAGISRIAQPNEVAFFDDIFVSAEVELNNGDYLEVYYQFYSNDPMSSETADYGYTYPRMKVYNSVPQEYDIIYGDTIDYNKILPRQIKQRDFLKSIITMHNLYVEADPVQSNRLNFIPYPLYYETDASQSIDWSNKLDVSQDIKIIPIGELTAREYNISYENDNDYWSQLYRTKFNEIYGQYRRLVDNDFELQTQNIRVLFGTPVMREESLGLKILHLYKVQNSVKQPDNFKPRIAFWKAVVPCPAWNITIGGTTFSAGTNYPYAGHLDDPINPTKDLCFGTPQEVWFTIGSYPSANLGNSFYKDFFDAITDKDSKLVQGYFHLTPLDIKNLRFNSLIKIGNHYFRLQKIEQYNPYGNDLQRNIRR